jgi:hypothetical protein
LFCFVLLCFVGCGNFFHSKFAKRTTDLAFSF